MGGCRHAINKKSLGIVPQRRILSTAHLEKNVGEVGQNARLFVRRLRQLQDLQLVPLRTPEPMTRRLMLRRKVMLVLESGC